jgi:2'-5' RNA ligase
MRNPCARCDQNQPMDRDGIAKAGAITDDEPVMADTRRASPSHFFFYASCPPEAVAREMAEAWESLGTGETLRRDKLHMTLLLVTDVVELPEGLIDQLVAAGSTIRRPAFDVEFDRLATWRHGRGRNNPIVLTPKVGRCPGAEAIARDLLEALPEILHWPQWRLVPHVTLAYGKGFPEDLPLPRPIRWHIDSFTLTESLRGKGKHIPHHIWRLDDGAPAQPLADGSP